MKEAFTFAAKDLEKAILALSDRQKQYAETVAEKMWNAYKAEGFYYKQILPDIIAFMQTDQTDDDWLALGNGMDNPIERGWM